MTGVLLVVAKVTLLLASGFGALAMARRATAAARHRLCVAVLLATLAVPLTLLIPNPAVAIAIHVPSIAGLRANGGPAAKPIAWLPMLTALWASGCALVLFRCAIGCVGLARLRRRAIAAGEARQGVPILGADVSVPMLTGFLRPAILLPQSASEWPESRREAAIQHELKHLDRRDLWTNLVAVGGCAVYWFHPLVWALARTLREEQESACDDGVIAAGFDCADYAEALVETARGAVGYPLVSCRMTDGGTVKRRVARILAAHGGPRQRPNWALRAAPALVLLALAAACAIGEERVYVAANGITQPVLIHKVNPRYTPEARARKAQGSLWAIIVVGADGAVKDVVVEQGIDPDLDRSAAQAIRQWRFRPAERGGKPVSVSARAMVRFRLA